MPTLTDLHFSKIKMSRSQVQCGKKTWITKDILQSIKIQNNLYRLYKSSRNNEDHSKYKAYRNNLTRAKNNAKTEYYRQLLENSCDSSKTWKVSNKILNNNKTKVLLYRRD